MAAEPSIARLPTEILHEIFSLTIAASTSTKDVSSPPPPFQDASWRLGHVCGRWRAAAISHSMLWTTISITREYTPPVGLLDRQLQLSRDLPLTITFHQTESERSLKLFEALVACSSRWSYLSVKLTGAAFLKALDGARGRVPLLRTLSLDGSASTTGNPFAFEIAPALRDVTLHFRPVPIIDWGRLTRLSMTCPLTMLLPVLRLAQNLIELTALVLEYVDVANPNTEPIELPLVSRCLLFHRRLIDILILPQLEIFIAEPETAEALVSLLHRSSCSLKKLGLYGACSTAAITSILLASPALVEITIMSSSESDTAYLNFIIGHLSVPTNDNLRPVVPYLKHIFIMADNLDQTQLVDMVESRWRVTNSSPRLEQLTVMPSQKWEDTAATRLSLFQDEGLMVRM
ncbi:hypothetical protein C8R46DRAFT_651922 [Mycena filopes]|nr:hypothetical protein C8R46DRAFT_651922 [Mycena filopes]